MSHSLRLIRSQGADLGFKKIFTLLLPFKSSQPYYFHSHRSSQDLVRRRRWLRVRQLHPPMLLNPTRPLTCFWEINTMENGSRLAIIRSHMQIVNCMPFPMMISLYCSSWEEDVELGPIEESEVFGVPVLYAYASNIKFKPVSASCDWSPPIGCSLQIRNLKTLIEVACEGIPGTNSRPVCIRVITRQQDQSLLISLVPAIIITNRLPCSLQYRVYSSSDGVEEGLVAPGVGHKLARIDLGSAPKVSFKFGNYQWSKLKIINIEKSRKSLIGTLNTFLPSYTFYSCCVTVYFYIY